MARLGPAVFLSVAAHAVLLAVLALPLRDGGETLDVVEVAALFRPRPPEPRIEPPEPPEEPEPEPAPRTPRRRSPRTPPPAETTSEPTTEAATPTEPIPVEAPPPAPEASEPPATPPHLTTAYAARPSAAASSRGETGGGGPSRPVPRRRGGRDEVPDPCVAARQAVSARLASMSYPAWVRDLGLTGTVRINLRVGRDGRARGIRVASSSGHAALDRHASRAVRGLRDLPACSRPIVVPVAYSIGRR